MKIFINPGHGPRDSGPYDPGAVGLYSKEAEIALEIGDKLNQLLISLDIQTKLYQNGDRNKIVQTANQGSYDYFISIHCNAHGDPQARGTETLIVGQGGKAEVLAKVVQERLVQSLGLTDRGVKVRPGLQVLNSTKMPAILIETAFISNLKEETLLITDVFQTKIAGAIVMALLEVEGAVTKTAQNQALIQLKCQFTDPKEVWQAIETHRFPDAVYEKLAQAMKEAE